MGVKCSKCQHENPSSSKYCNACGFRFSWPKKDIDSVTESYYPAKEDVGKAVKPELKIPYQEEEFGNFRIIQKIGEGGMGVVYEAEQQNPQRRVALKVIRGGPFIEKQQIKLFQREVQALARLKHPGIATIYESGLTNDGQHFFAMELVQGVPLMKYIERHIPYDISEKSGLQNRLRLFQKICDAISYAHQKGVIHRDLKPSNILVLSRAEDDSPDSSLLDGTEVKILDFGLARITDLDMTFATAVSEAGQIRGTVPYMSPEQIMGVPDEIDIRSDVYTLGVILYEMITNRLPYKLTDAVLPESARIICEEEPIPPSRASITPGSINRHKMRNIDKDLDTIVLKALEKEPERRYQSALAFAEDIERYLTSQAILARPPSTLYQLNRLISRHKLTFTFIVALFVLISGSALVMMVQRNRAITAEEKASREAEKARAINSFLQNMFSSADPSVDGREVKVADVLERAAGKIGAEFKDQPEIQGALFNTVGTTFVALGLHDKARSQLEEALKIRKAALGPFHQDTLSSMGDLAAIMYYQGKFPEAEQLFRETIELKREALGIEHRETLVSMANLGALLNMQGKYNDAEATFRELLDSCQNLDQDDPIVPTAINNLALSLRHQEKFFEAEKCYREALDIWMKSSGEEHPETLNIMNNLAFLLNQQGKSIEAEKLHRQTLEIQKRVLGPKHPKTLASMNGIGLALRAQKKYEEAEEMYRQLIEIASTALPQNHFLLHVYCGRYGYCLFKLGRLEEAEQFLVKAFSELKNIRGEDHKDTKNALRDLIQFYEEWGKEKKASEYRALLEEKEIKN